MAKAKVMSNPFRQTYFILQLSQREHFVMLFSNVIHT